MYQQHFGLKELPFSLTPDTSYFYRYPDHQEALNVLLVALEMNEGFIKVTGEVGTGKSLICRKLLNLLSDRGLVTAYIPNPILGPGELRHLLADELGIEHDPAAPEHRMLQLINEELIRLRYERKQVVLLIDEAQALPDESLEAIRLLTNLETEKTKLLHVILFGQPELDVRLDRPSARQLRQRITFSHKLKSMSRAGVGGYLSHRLQVAGYEGSDVFDSRAVAALYRGSGGVPRLMNIIAHKALLAAYGEGTRRVKRRLVLRAIRDTEGARAGMHSLHRLLIYPRGFAVSMAVWACLIPGIGL